MVVSAIVDSNTLLPVQKSNKINVVEDKVNDTITLISQPLGKYFWKITMTKDEIHNLLGCPSIEASDHGPPYS